MPGLVKCRCGAELVVRANSKTGEHFFACAKARHPGSTVPVATMVYQLNEALHQLSEVKGRKDRPSPVLPASSHPAAPDDDDATRSVRHPMPEREAWEDDPLLAEALATASGWEGE